MALRHPRREVLRGPAIAIIAGAWLLYSIAGPVGATTDTAFSPIPFGDAGFYGAPTARALVAPIVAMTATTDGAGYWVAGADGGVFSFGDARFYGSMGARRLAMPVVGMAPTPDGGGYWLVASDGGVFSFGDARFYGSMGDHTLGGPVVGMADSPGGTGYWLAGADGAVYGFGDARMFGSAARRALSGPVVSMASTTDGAGYWLAASDGGVFSFGDARFYGSAAGSPLAFPVRAMARTPAGAGYWLLPTSSPSPLPSASSGAGVVIRTVADVPGQPAGQKVVALTFDDGPDPTYTPQILRILTAYGAPASFSVIGRQGAAYPSLLDQEAAGGFALVNHTWDHVDLTRLPEDQWPGEVDRTSTLLARALGHPTACLRPPSGYTNAAVIEELGQRHLDELLWSIDPSDYLMPGPDVIARRVFAALSPGAVILLHDGGGDRSETVSALSTIINGIRSAGYRIVSVCK